MALHVSQQFRDNWFQKRKTSNYRHLIDINGQERFNPLGKSVPYQVDHQWLGF